MRRREFVTKGAAITGSQLFADSLAAQTDTQAGLPPAVLFDLFDKSPDIKSNVQDVLFLSDRIYCLFVDSTRQYGISATTLNGARLWQYRLSRRLCTGLAISKGQPLVMVLGGEGPAGLVAIADAGQEQFVAPLPSGFGRTSFLGDSLLLNQTPGRVEIWRIESSAVNRVGSAGLEFPGGLVRPLTLSDLSKVALVDPGGSQIIVITIPSCEMVSSRISIPEVEAAMRGYEAAASAMPVDRRARGNVFPATGIDAHDFLYGVVFPAPWNNAAIVKFDLMGQGSIWRSVQLRPGKIPPRWLCFPDAGLRIVFADGAMAQYVA